MPETAEAPAAPSTRALPRRSGQTGHRSAYRLLRKKPWAFLRLGVDAALLVLAVVSARLGADAADVAPDGQMLVWLFPPLVLALLAFRGAYRTTIRPDPFEGLLRVLAVSSLVAMGLIASAALIDPESDPARLLARTWAFGALYLGAGWLLLTTMERRARRTGAMSKPTLVVGAGEVGTQVERRLAEAPDLGLRLVGYIDADPVPHDRVPHRRAPILGSPDEFVSIAERTGAEHVILTFTSSPDRVLIPLVRACEEHGIEVSLVPRLFESVNLRLQLESLGSLPLFRLDWVDPKGWQFNIKHSYDRLFSALLLLALSPLLVVIAIAIKLTSPGPVLFKQYRIGRDGGRFYMLKFRSMHLPEIDRTAPVPAEGLAPGGVEGDDRRTSLGRFLRRWSLDELPQLINVLRGDMSLIGPRPERPEFVELFDEQVRRYSDRHRVKSGVTGLAQVNGLRGQTPLVDRVELDNYYIQNWSMALDVRILVRTIAAIFRSGE